MDSLIVRSKVKKFVLEKAKVRYAHVHKNYMPTRVSEQFLNDTDTHLRIWIEEMLQHRIPKGKTI